MLLYRSAAVTCARHRAILNNATVPLSGIAAPDRQPKATRGRANQLAVPAQDRIGRDQAYLLAWRQLRPLPLHASQAQFRM